MKTVTQSMSQTPSRITPASSNFQFLRACIRGYKKTCCAFCPCLQFQMPQALPQGKSTYPFPVLLHCLETTIPISLQPFHALLEYTKIEKDRLYPAPMSQALFFSSQMFSDIQQESSDSTRRRYGKIGSSSKSQPNV